MGQRNVRVVAPSDASLQVTGISVAYQLYPFDVNEAFAHNVSATNEELMAGSDGSEWSGYRVVGTAIQKFTDVQGRPVGGMRCRLMACYLEHSMST